MIRQSEDVLNWEILKYSYKMAMEHLWKIIKAEMSQNLKTEPKNQIFYLYDK